MEINGLPLHPLIVHLVVVLTPVAGLLAVLYAVVPRWRWCLRWPFVAASVVGAAVTWLAARAGSDLKRQLHLSGPLMEAHERWANRLEISMVVLAVVALLAAYALPFASPLARGRDHDGRVRVVAVPLAVVMALAGVVVMFVVYKTGDAGARLVWQR